MTAEQQGRPGDEELLRRAELALTQLNNRHGLETDQAATLTAIRLRLEGRERASLEDLLDAGADRGGEADPLRDAMRRHERGPSFEDALDAADKRPKRTLDDLF